MRRPDPATVRWMILAALLILWEVVPLTGALPELFLPSLSKTLTVLYIDRHIYFAALLVTLYEVALSMLIACGLGILIGALVGGFAMLRDLLLPIFSSLYAVPIVILYPVFTAWFGIGSSSKIAFAGIYGFFPVMLSTAAGIRTIDPQFLLAARSMGATLPQQITRVIIPASLPTDVCGVAARRRADHHRRGGRRDADLLGRHRLPRDAQPHHPRQPARVRGDPGDPGAVDRLLHIGARAGEPHGGVAVRRPPAAAVILARRAGCGAHACRGLTQRSSQVHEHLLD